MTISEKDFFNRLTEQYEGQLPFVAYRKPAVSEKDDCDLFAILQKDDTLYRVKDYTEHGFVFSPFDQAGDTVLIPVPVPGRAVSSGVLHTRCKGIKEETEKEWKATGDTLSGEQHIELVKQGVRAIKNGKLEKVVLSRKQQVPLHQPDVIGIFRRLLGLYDDAFCYIWYHPKVGIWFGATPEILLRIRENRLYTMALAGTQKFRGKEDVVWGSKEIREQQVVTDAIVDSLRFKVNRLKIAPAKTQRAGNLLHIKTDIEAELAKDFKCGHIASLLRELHPTPAICGFPRKEAMQFIREHEGYSRTYYSGFLGELNMDSGRDGTEVGRNSAFYVNLRCMQVRGEEATLYVGGGITADSDPEAEWQETVNKSETMRKVLV